MRVCTVAVFSTPVVLACACTSPPTSQDSGADAEFEVGADAPDTRGQELARREELLRQVVGKTCEGLFECYPVSSQRIYGADLPTCIDMEAPHFFGLREEIEHVKVDEEQVRECLASLEQRPCHYLIEENEYPLAQGCDFRGDKAVGEPCLHRWACESGVCSSRYNRVRAGVCDGFCQERIDVGQPCDDDDEARGCADDSRCDFVSDVCLQLGCGRKCRSWWTGASELRSGVGSPAR